MKYGWEEIIHLFVVWRNCISFQWNKAHKKGDDVKKNEKEICKFAHITSGCYDSEEINWYHMCLHKFKEY